MTEFKTKSDFAALSVRVLDASLPRGEWTHAAHFALALWVLRRRPELGDVASFRTIIMRLNDAHGTANTNSSGYHHTITVASLRSASVMLAAHREAALPDVLRAMMVGRYGRSDWIFTHWSRDVLFSVPARRGWVDPDIHPLD